MPFPSLESALNKVSNRYLLVVLSAKRARQLNRGAQAVRPGADDDGVVCFLAHSALVRRSFVGLDGSGLIQIAVECQARHFTAEAQRTQRGRRRLEPNSTLTEQLNPLRELCVLCASAVN